MKQSPCIGCGSVLPDVAGPTHGYLESSPACWQTYCEVLAREYGDPSLFKAVHRLTVDAYAVQHPGHASPRSIQSVAVHLMGLCTVLGDGSSAEWASKVIREAVEGRVRFIWLPPPASLGPLTVVDVGKAKGAAEHERRVRDWASSVWEAWSPHHATIRLWCSVVRKGRIAAPATVSGELRTGRHLR